MNGAVPLPPEVELRVKLPGPMVWRMQEIAEQDYSVTLEQFVIMQLARAMRKPRGPKQDLTEHWRVYEMWRRRESNAKIAETLGTTTKRVATILEAMGLPSAFVNHTRRSLKGWETRRALLAQAEKAARDSAAQTGGEADRKAREAEQRRAQRAKSEGEAA